MENSISEENLVERPQAPDKKIHNRDQFELCYLRHQYIRRVNYNPTEKEMSPYYKVVENLARHTYLVYGNLFSLVGFYKEDVVSIAKIHLVSYIGLFSLEKMPEKYKAFIEIYSQKHGVLPDESANLNKNKANLTIFIKQRMEDLVRVCRQKARNIKGLPTEEFYAFYGNGKLPKDMSKLLKDNEKYGYKKIDMSIYKSIKKRAKHKDKTPFKFAGFWYVCVDLHVKNLSLEDLTGAGFDPYDNAHNKTPEQIVSSSQDHQNFEYKKSEFYGQSLERRKTRLYFFIYKNKQNPLFKEEIKIARKMLKDMLA